MEVIKGLDKLKPEHSPSVASIGNYDGVHLGHQYVIKTLLKKSREFQVPSTVITFDPLAKEFFQPNSVHRLTSLEERAERLFSLGVDRVLCIDFDAEFALCSPTSFVQDILGDGLGVKYLCVGDDFRFGKDRRGDFAFLQETGRRRGFNVSSHETFELHGERVSSGRVREALLAGNFKLAEELLGRAYVFTGVVSKGQQLGRTLDFPTANIVLPNYLVPVNGVYAAKIEHQMHGQLDGVVNVGTRPTVDGTQNRLEVHIFDFDKVIYGEEISVRFVEKIRDELKFDSIESLKQQISVDADKAREILGKKTT